MARRKGLGRGLDALLGASASQVAENSNDYRELPVDLIERSPFQPRTVFDEEALEELAASIRVRGVVQPVVVRRTGDGARYELVAGERRWRAAQRAGLTELPAVICEVPDEAALGISLIENIQREDLNPVEEAAALRRLVDEFELTHQQAAEAVGRSRAAVSNLLRLLDLESGVRALLEGGSLEMGHARALLALPATQQGAAAAEVVAKGLSARETEALVNRLLRGGKAKRSATGQQDPDVKRLEQTLGERLGATVRIQSGRRGTGKLVIDFTSHEQLDGILERIK